MALVLVWAMVVWASLRPANIVNDWMGWRQSDTQQMALNAATEGANFNVPRINWGGPKPAPVEAEFQAYTELIAVLFHWFGPAEWPGQLLSLICLALAAFVLSNGLITQFGATAGFLGTLAFLFNRDVLFLATSIQPNGLGLMAFVIGMVGFDRWLRQPTFRHWAVWVAASALAALVQPLNLQIGIAQFLWVLLAHRNAMKAQWLWVGWLAILLAVAAQLLHGATIFHRSGLTFGILNGGDSKLPTVMNLFKPGHYLAILQVSWGWGLQPAGFVAAAWLLLRRKVGMLEWSLALAYATAMVVGMRYTIYAPFGSHYHAPVSLLSAILVAKAADALLKKNPHQVALSAVLALLLAAQLTWNVHARLSYERNERSSIGYVWAANDLRDRIHPGEILIVRSEAKARVVGWRGGPNNFEDPRLLYLLRATGWVIARDDFTVSTLDRAWRKGARWYIEPLEALASPEQLAWLTKHGKLILNKDYARAWQLDSLP